jgi:hypothetical protein
VRKGWRKRKEGRRRRGSGGLEGEREEKREGKGRGD